MSKAWQAIYGTLFVGVIWALFQTPMVEQRIFILGVLIFMTVTSLAFIRQRKESHKRLLSDNFIFILGFLIVISTGFLWTFTLNINVASQLVSIIITAALLTVIRFATFQKFGWHHILGFALIGQIAWEWAYALHFTTSSPFLNIFLGVVG